MKFSNPDLEKQKIDFSILSNNALELKNEIQIIVCYVNSFDPREYGDPQQLYKYKGEKLHQNNSRIDPGFFY